MAKRKKSKKKKRAAKRKRAPAPEESQAAEATTVAWLLAVFATLAAEVVAISVTLLAPEEADESLLWLAIPELFFFSGLATGVVGLLLTPATLRSRKVHPPRSLVIGAVMICALPLAIEAARWLTVVFG